MQIECVLNGAYLRRTWYSAKYSAINFFSPGNADFSESDFKFPFPLADFKSSLLMATLIKDRLCLIVEINFNETVGTPYSAPVLSGILIPLTSKSGVVAVFHFGTLETAVICQSTATGSVPSSPRKSPKSSPTKPVPTPRYRPSLQFKKALELLGFSERKRSENKDKARLPEFPLKAILHPNPKIFEVVNAAKLLLKTSGGEQALVADDDDSDSEQVVLNADIDDVIDLESFTFSFDELLNSTSQSSDLRIIELIRCVPSDKLDEIGEFILSHSLQSKDQLKSQFDLTTMLAGDPRIDKMLSLYVYVTVWYSSTPNLFG